jgi:hypothetical protein
MKRFSATTLVCAALSSALPSSAQTTAPTATRPDPLDARAAVPSVLHTPALRTYRRLADEPRLPWRDANDQVERIGGWRAYAREAAAEPQASAALPAPSTPSAPDPAPAPAPAPAHRHHHQP